jgi:hypothetical protein
MKRLFLILFCVSVSFSIFAQNGKREFPFKNKIVYDTLVVYDTIFVTDTVHLLKNRTPETQLANLPMQTILLESEAANKENQQFLLINRDFAATFSSQRILLSEKNTNHFTTKNSDKMKKIGFFGVVFFAFQNLLIAQDKFSFSLASGFHNQRTPDIVTIDYKNATGKSTTQAKPFVKLGVHLSEKVLQEKLRLETGLQYYFLQRSDFQTYTPDPKFMTTFNGGDDFSKNTHLFTLPVSVQWNSYKIKPLIGAEFFYKLKPYTVFFTDANGATVRQQVYYNLPVYGFSTFLGAGVMLGKQIEARLTYNKGLTSEKTDQPNGSQYKTKMNRYELSFRYNLLKK